MLEEYTEIPIKKIRGDGFITLARFDENSKFMYICDQESDLVKRIDAEDYTLNRSFAGHDGIIWDVSISERSIDMMTTVSGDMTFIIWEISTGDIILKKEIENGIPKIVKFNKSCDKLAISINSFGKNGKNKILVLSNISKESLSSNTFITNEIMIETPVTAMEWNDDNLLVGYQNGLINLINSSNNKILTEKKMFDKSTKFEQLWLTASSDCTSKEFNINTFEIINTYNHDYPINVAKYNYNNRKIYLGGGLDAMEVAKTNNNDLTLKVFKRGGKMTNIINGHFGPIRDLNFSKVNNNFITASQDGTIIVHLVDNVSEKKPESEPTESTKIKEVVDSTMTTKEKLIDDIFGNMKTQDDIPKNEIKDDVVKMKNLGFRAPKVVEMTKYVPGMPKPQHIIEQEKFERELREPKATENSSNKFPERQKLYGIKIFGMDPNTREGEIRDIFENFGRISGGRGVKLIASEKEFTKINGKKQKYKDLMIIINYLSEESANRAVINMNKRAFGSILIDVQHCS